MTLLTEPTRIVLAKGQPVPVDLNRSNVSLLLHGDGTNGSATITDSSPTPKTVTAVGNAQISTGGINRAAFGNSSIAFDGTGDYLTISPSSSAFVFAINDFTVEFWYYQVATTLFPTVIDTRASGESLTNRWTVYFNTTSNLVFQGGGANIVTTTAQLATWHHYAATRASGLVKVFLDGVQQGSSVSAPADLGLGVSRPLIGANTDLNASYNGYIDDLRITKGVARYTANFTPPTLPFPDF